MTRKKPIYFQSKHILMPCFSLASPTSMGSGHRHQSAWVAVSTHLPSQTVHHHYLKRTQENPGSSFTNARSCTRSFWFNSGSDSTDKQPLLRSETDSPPPSRNFSSDSRLHFPEKYGRCLEILHYGNNSTVRLHRRGTHDSKQKLLAVKVYRHKILDFSHPSYHSSNCSPVHLADLHPRHPNILPIIDLLRNERSELCLVMPYSTGGDLHELLCRTGPLPTFEADCLVTQILRALAFLHKNKIAHQDIRLETVLLTEHGAVKLAGFGDSHIRRLWAESAIPVDAEETCSPGHAPVRTSSWWLCCFPWLLSSLSSSISLRRGSGAVSGCSASFPGINRPYIPPEGYHHRPSHSSRDQDEANQHQTDHDPRPADVWATAIIYLALVTGRILWQSARPGDEDPRYLDYLHDRCRYGYPQIEVLGEVITKLHPKRLGIGLILMFKQKRRNAIYAMLDPRPQRRITSSQMLQSEWVSAISVCEAGKRGY